MNKTAIILRSALPLAFGCFACESLEAVDAEDASPVADDDALEPDDDGDDAAPGVEPASDEFFDPDTQAVGLVTSMYRSRKLDTTTGLLDASNKFTDTIFNFDRTGYTFIRTAVLGSDRYLFLMESQSGQVDIYRIEANNTLGAHTQSIQLEKTWTGATIGAHGFTNYLFLLNADTGEVRRHVFNSNGTISTGASTVSIIDSDWEDIANFDSYRLGTTLYLAGLDPWNAKHRIYKGDLTYLTGSNWTRGWTSIDHVDISGTGYMLSYKAAGDPYTLGDTSQTGRLALQSIDAAGNHTILSDSNSGIGGGWTTVRFVPIPGSIAKRILFYNAATGAYKLHAFSSGSGIGAQIGTQQFTTAGLSDIDAYATATETFLLQLSEDARDPLDWSEAEKFGACVHTALTTSDTATQNPVVGYQFGVIQHGRVVYRRGWGNSKLSPAVAMTTRTPVDIGSVSKILTTMHVLKLADEGDVDLDTPIADNIDPTLYTGLNAWTGRITVRDLMKRESGITTTGGCVGASDLSTSCELFFDDTQEGGNCGGTFPQCNRTPDGVSGYNASYGALREVLEFDRGLTTSIDVDFEAHDLWMDALELYDTTCLANSNVYYFGTAGDNCTVDGVSCVTDANGAKRVQGRFEPPPNQWSGSCGAGGWQSSVQQLLRLLAGIQHEKVLSSAMTDQLLDTTLTAPNGNSAVGWEAPLNWAGPSANLMTLDKGGDRGVAVAGFQAGTHTLITTLPDNAAAVLLINTDDGDSGSNQRNTVRAAYQFAIGQAGSCVDGW